MSDNDMMTETMAARLRGDWLQLMARPVQLADLDEIETPAAAEAVAVAVADVVPAAAQLSAARPVGRKRTARPVATLRQLPALDLADAF